MQPFTILRASGAPIDLMNIDTDMIIPKQFLKTIKREGLGKNLFDDMRYDEQGNEKPDFILNKDGFRHAEILIAGDNFGCGSSREHAPWALLDFGIRAIIAPSYADIFYNNCFKNGILPITLPKEQVQQCMEQAQNGANAIFDIDLNDCVITTPQGQILSFEVEAFRRHCLLNGLDDIAMTLQKHQDISAYEQKIAVQQPWVNRI